MSGWGPGQQSLSYRSFAVCGEGSSGGVPRRGCEAERGFLKIGDTKAHVHTDGWIW